MADEVETGLHFSEAMVFIVILFSRLLYYLHIIMILGDASSVNVMDGQIPKSKCYFSTNDLIKLLEEDPHEFNISLHYDIFSPSCTLKKRNSTPRVGVSMRLRLAVSSNNF